MEQNNRILKDQSFLNIISLMSDKDKLEMQLLNKETYKLVGLAM